MTIAKNPVKRIKFLLFAFIAVTAVSLATAVSAQTPTGNLDLTVSPPVFDLTAEPGDQVRETFRIRNNGATPIALKVSARRLISDPNSGDPIPETEVAGEELSWVSFEPGTFTAPPREWTNVNFTIDIPESAAYGYYYVFSIAPRDESEQAATGAAIHGELLVVTLLNVKKDGAVSTAGLIKFAPKNFITEYLPVSFDTQIENTGNVHVKPHGNVFITRGEGRELAILDVNTAFGSVLPGGKRIFESSWTDGFLVREPVMEDGEAKLDSSGQPQTKLKINWNKLTSFRIGPYTARLLLVYDDGTRDQTIEGVTTFWVIPYTALAVIAAVTLVLFLILRMLLRSYVRSQIKKGGK
jgi:hypothetical protein